MTDGVGYLSRTTGIDPAEINNYPIVCMSEGTAPRAMFARACAAKGLHPDIVLQASAPDAVADLASRGLGVAILTESLAANHHHRLTALLLYDITAPTGLAIIWGKSTGLP